MTKRRKVKKKKRQYAIQVYHRFAGAGNEWVPFGFTWVDESRRTLLSRFEVWMRDNLISVPTPRSRMDRVWSCEYTAFWVSPPKRGRQAMKVYNYRGKLVKGRGK